MIVKRLRKSSPDRLISCHDIVIFIQKPGVRSAAKKLNLTPKDPQILDQFRTILGQALEKRAKSINVKKQDGKVVIGLNIDLEYAYETVIKGPSAENHEEVQKFVQFWGEKAETRRFPDLTILEAVHFDCRTISDRRKIVPKIVKLVLQRHLKIEEKDVEVFDENWDQVLRTKNQSINSGTGEEILSQTSEIFEELKKSMRQLKDVPLNISSIKGISPIFRQSEVYPNVLKPDNLISIDRTMVSVEDSCLKIRSDAKQLPQYLKPYEATIELETTGKWPDELNALRHVKTQILSNLRDQVSKQLGLPTRLMSDHIDVCQRGLVFKFYLLVRKEVTLLRGVETITGLRQVARGTIKEADQLEQRIDFLPKVTSALNGIATQNITYSTAVRMAKRWVSSQYLCDYMSDLVIELMMAHVYMSPSFGHSEPPKSPSLGFVRFLELIADFDWSQEPLFVNFNEELDDDKITFLKKSFSKTTKSRSAFAIYTPYDPTPGAVSKPDGHVNSAPIFGTLLKNAKLALDELCRNTVTFDILTIFHHPIGSYHVVINVHPQYVTNLSHALFHCSDYEIRKSKKSKKSNQMKAIPVIGFDPIQIYVDTLRSSFKDAAMFFRDAYGGSKVLVYFMPSTMEQFSSSSNLDEVLKTFEDMGHGLVSEVVIQSENLTSTCVNE